MYSQSANPIGRHQQLTVKVPTVMYPAAITWKDNSGETASEDSPGLNGSMPGVDELFKTRIMFDNTGIRSLKRNLNGMGMLYYSCKAE